MTTRDELSIRCPYCHKATAISWATLKNPQGVTVAYDRLSYSAHGELWSMGKCNACGKPVLVSGLGNILPPPRPEPVSEPVPDPMRADLWEARVCFTVGAYKAAVVMARRAIQCACLKRGASPKNAKGNDAKLWEQIDEVTKLGHLTSDLRDAAHAVRWVGNNGAHAEPEEALGVTTVAPVSKDDAEETLDLADDVLAALFVTKAKADARLAKSGKTVKPLGP